MQLHHGEDTYLSKRRSYLYLKTITLFQIYRCCRTPIKATTFQFGFLVFLSHLKRVCKLKDIAAGLQKFAVIITV